jgi:hypothetical protein
LTRLDQAMADPAAGGVILAGPPGVGKTRLAMEAVATAKGRGSYGRLFASAAFVHQLAVSAQAFVVVTIRSGERVLDPITALWKDGLVAPASRLSHARRQHPPRPDRIARRRPRLAPERH